MKFWCFVGFTIFSILIFGIFTLSMYCNYSYFKEGGAMMLNNEVSFDKEYFDLRRKDKFANNIFTLYLYKNVKLTKVKDFHVMNPFKNTETYQLLSNYTVNRYAGFNSPFFSDLIYNLYFDIKNFESEFSKKFFENREVRIDYWGGKSGHDLKSKVKNIILNVPSREFLTNNEISQFNYLFNEIAINGVKSTPSKFEDLKNILAQKYIRNPEAAILSSMLYVYNLDQLKLLLEGLSKELNIKFNIYDISNQVPNNSISTFNIAPENPMKEISMLYFVPQQFNSFTYVTQHFNGQYHNLYYPTQVGLPRIYIINPSD